MTPARPKSISAVAVRAAVAAAVTAGVVLLAQTNCASNCASDCPPATVYIGNLDNQQLYIDDIRVSGPACPPQYGIYCIGDGVTTSCTHITISGMAQGICDVLFVFHDRPAMVVRTEFGPPIQHGCCKGYTIVGDSVFEIPAAADAGISGLDGGSDQVSIYDGGAGQ